MNLPPVTTTLHRFVQGRVGKGEMLRALVPHGPVFEGMEDDGTPFRHEGVAVVFTSREAAAVSGWADRIRPVDDWLAMDVAGILWDEGTSSEFPMGTEDLETCRRFARSLAAEQALLRPAGELGARRILDGAFTLLIDVSKDVPPTATWSSDDGIRLVLAFTTPELADAWGRDHDGAWEPVDYDGAGLARFVLDADMLDGACINPEGPSGPVVLGPAWFAALLDGHDLRTEPRPARTIGEIRLWLRGQRSDVAPDAWEHALVRKDGQLLARYTAPDGRVYDFTPVDDPGLPETLGPILDPGWVLQAATEAPAPERIALYRMVASALDGNRRLPRVAFHDPRQAMLRRRYPERFWAEAWV